MTKTGSKRFQVHAVHCGRVRCCTMSHLIWNGVPFFHLFQQPLKSERKTWACWSSTVPRLGGREAR